MSVKFALFLSIFMVQSANRYIFAAPCQETELQGMDRASETNSFNDNMMEWIMEYIIKDPKLGHKEVSCFNYGIPYACFDTILHFCIPLQWNC